MHDFISPDNKHSALIIVDVQRDFALSGSSAEIPVTMQALHHLQILAEGYRNLGYPIIHVVRMPKGGCHRWEANGNSRQYWRRNCGRT
jgi:nicotinamidase-related amidase